MTITLRLRRPTPRHQERAQLAALRQRIIDDATRRMLAELAADATRADLAPYAALAAASWQSIGA